MRDARITILDEVRTFVSRLSPQPVCDDCIAGRLELAAREDASRQTGELAGERGFERSKATCSLCGMEKLVIQRM